MARGIGKPPSSPLNDGRESQQDTCALAGGKGDVCQVTLLAAAFFSKTGMVLGDLQVPCGYDSLSYSWRDSEGKAFHRSRGRDFGPAEGFAAGDVLGFQIILEPVARDATLFRKAKKAVVCSCHRRR